MTTRTQGLARRGFAVALAGALGFGALAALSPVRQARADPACNTRDCRASCIASGAQTGFCDTVGCVCRL
ncbi:MAG TPA: hypothetical protein VF771_18915 [Longimicrobiaceae bacterium]